METETRTDLTALAGLFRPAAGRLQTPRMIQQPEISGKLSPVGAPFGRRVILSPKMSKPTDSMPGRVLALDLGTVRVGVAVSDELRLTVRPLPTLKRTNWKQLTRDVAELCSRFDVKRVVLGLPLRLDGSEGDAAAEARRVARNLGLTLRLPVSLQDERHTSADAETAMRADSLTKDEIARRVDGEAAALILTDFLSRERTPNRGEPESVQQSS